MGFEDEVEQSLRRPCGQTDGRSKQTYDLTSSIVPRGTSIHRSVELEFPPIGCDLAKFSGCYGGGAASPFAAMAQEPGRTYHMGCLLPNPPNEYVAFFDGLRRRGFIEGQNLTVEYRAYGQHVDLIPQYAAELVKARVDVIAGSGDEAVRALQQATKTIPIVGMVSDMLWSGLVTSLARPDGNTMGVSMLTVETDGKRLDILIEAVPGLRRMAALIDVNFSIKVAKLDALQKAARARNVEFSIYRVAKGEDIAPAIDSAQASGATALNIVSSPLFHAHRHLIMERAAAAHLPTIYEFPESAEEGGFAAYGPREESAVYRNFRPSR